MLLKELRHRALSSRRSVRHRVDVQFCGAIAVKY